MLILTKYTAKHELEPLLRQFTLDDILEGARKVLKNLATPIRNPVKLEGYRFFKVRIGRKAKGRMIVFLVTENKKVVPVLIRLKKDKIFGMNMSLNNPEVVRELRKNIDFILRDIEKKEYQEFLS
ncbi:hypothetical protein HZA38_05270 [Candidatus Peregrinibacteria bacterium]|nr:hypothetical protein [Candidatus Peregrinibacteria bacterium]